MQAIRVHLLEDLCGFPVLVTLSIELPLQLRFIEVEPAMVIDGALILLSFLVIRLKLLLSNFALSIDPFQLSSDESQTLLQVCVVVRELVHVFGLDGVSTLVKPGLKVVRGSRHVEVIFLILAV
jgi:hypothetical protein